uniref:Ig-like domain-containing protein n=1 Tax=Acanthochromis polyacanthus TaxID=80966 RepID=A0A3Q1GW92_9TELE
MFNLRIKSDCSLLFSCNNNNLNSVCSIKSSNVSFHFPVHTVLVCSVYDFYPKQIKVIWFRDEQEVTSGVSSTGVMENGDWYYQIHSSLVYTPRNGEKISCVVEHASLKEPLRTYWGKYLSSDKEKIAIGASALILGLVFGLAGFIYYRNHTPGKPFKS